MIEYLLPAGFALLVVAGFILYNSISSALKKGGNSDKATGASSGGRAKAKSKSGRFLTEVDMPAKLIRKGKCEYPKKAFEMRLEGVSYIDILIGDDGELKQMQIAKKAGHGFDEAAMKHIKSWSFEPAVYNGDYVESWIRVPVRFTIRNP